jgi:hypothetical protein
MGRTSFRAKELPDWEDRHLDASHARGLSGVPGAFQDAVRQRADAMLFAISPGLNTREVQARISELAIRHRMPVVHAYLPSYEWGGILAYGHDFTAMVRRLPYYVDRILRGDILATFRSKSPPSTSSTSTSRQRRRSA